MPIDLNKFGVRTDLQNKSPKLIDSRISFPKQFSRHLFKLWLYSLDKIDTDIAEAAWSQAIAAFLRFCAENKVYPFAHSSTRNNDAHEELHLARRSLCRYFSAWGILENGELKTEKTEHLITVADRGFKIRVSVPIWHLDQLELEKWIGRNMFFHYNGSNRLGAIDMRKRLNVHSRVHIGVAWTYSHTTHIWYEVSSTQNPYLPVLMTDEYNSDKHAFDKMVFDLFWEPLVRIMRIKNTPPNFNF